MSLNLDSPVVLNATSGGNICYWRNSDVGTLVVRRFDSDSDCEGDYEETTHTIKAWLYLTGTLGSNPYFRFKLSTVDDAHDVFFHYDSDVYPDCDEIKEYDNDRYCGYGSTKGLTYDGRARLTPGDIFNDNIRCPGGGAIWTDTNLKWYVDNNKRIEVADDISPFQKVCYRVEVDTSGHASDRAVTVSKYFDDCPDCCDEIGGTTP